MFTPVPPLPPSPVASSSSSFAGTSAEGSEAAVAKPKKAKPKPKGPKRPRNGLIFFSRVHRKQISGAHPELTFGQINSLVAKTWKETSTKDKAPFLREAEQDRARYYREVEELKRKNQAIQRLAKKS